MSEFLKFDRCLLCGSTHFSDLPGYHDNFLVKCSSCGFVFCNRKPAESELIEHYHKYNRDNPISPITMSRYDDLCVRFEKHRKTNNILDVGCGDGHFLSVAKQRGWNVFGTEFTQEAISVCTRLGIHMTQGSLEAASFEPGYFDVITSFEVIEHIHTPVSEASAMFQVIRPGGLLYVTTPNFNSISRSLIGPRWNMIEYPEHLCYFTKGTLLRLFRSSGFKCESITATGISLDRLRKSYHPVESENHVRVDEAIRGKVEKNFIFSLIKGFVNIVLNFLNKGDALKGLFVKPL